MQLKVIQKVQDILDNISNKIEDDVPDDQKDLSKDNRKSSLQDVIKYILSLIEAHKTKIDQARKSKHERAQAADEPGAQIRK